MGKAKKTRKYAVMKKQISPKDPRLYVPRREGRRGRERGGEVKSWVHTSSSSINQSVDQIPCVR